MYPYSREGRKPLNKQNSINLAHDDHVIEQEPLLRGLWDFIELFLAYYYFILILSASFPGEGQIFFKDIIFLTPK